ncbi:MAG: hypothetical protein ACTHPO_10820 [Alphaproteobacteria bacterium]
MHSNNTSPFRQLFNQIAKSGGAGTILGAGAALLLGGVGVHLTTPLLCAAAGSLVLNALTLKGSDTLENTCFTTAALAGVGWGVAAGAGKLDAYMGLSNIWATLAAAGGVTGAVGGISAAVSSYFSSDEDEAPKEQQSVSPHKSLVPPTLKVVSPVVSQNLTKLENAL